MIKGIGAHIKVSNFKKSKKFYETLGFKKVFEYGPDQDAREEYDGVVFEHGGCKLEMADGHRAVKGGVFKRAMEDSKISLMVYVDDLREIISKCEENGIDIAVGPRHYYWGTLEVVVKDPDGVVLVFIAPYSSEKAEEVNADETWGTPR